MSHRAAWRGSFILVPGMPRLLQLLSAAFAVRGSLAAKASCPSPAARLENLTSFPAYDKTARPNVDLGTPVDVGVQLYLAAIPEVDQKKQQFAIEGYFRLDWTDNRLATTGDPCASTLILELPVSSVWQPDIYWDNSLAEWYGAGAMNIYEDGRIYRSVRYKQTLRCPMNFQRLPFDKQQCFALLGSYSWDLHNVNASAFSNGAIVVPEGYDGTTEWQLEEATYEVTTEWFGAGADRKGYKYIWVYFNLNRRPNSFLMFVVGTAILFVLVAWAGLFIDRKVAPARVTIAVIPVLIMLNLENSVTSRLPELNYLTWLTSFLFVMKLFGLSCVFEYGLVWLLLQVEAERDRQFEALTQMSTIISKRSADQEGAMIAEPEFHNTDPLAVSVSASRHRKNQVVVPTPPKSQPSMLMPADGQVPLPDMTAVFKIFDSDGDADLSLTEVQKGLRQLGQYLSKGQVQEMFLRLGAEGNNIQQPHFRKFLLDVKKYLPGKAWKISYTEKPPSLQVDLAFRYLYLFGVLLVTIIWLAHRWE